MDKIKIQNLEVFAKHGVFQEERTLGQKFLVSATLYTDMKIPGKTDNLTDATNYGEVCHFITDFMTKNTYQLIETVADRLANGILLQFPLLQAVDIEIKKPWAPIGLPLDYVSVEVHRSWHRVYLSIGSNMGDKKANLEFGIAQLESTENIKEIKVSSYIETEPYGVLLQDTFLNAAVEMQTLCSPEELLQLLHKIEADAGRERLIHWGPRTLDLDILFYDDLVMDSADLIIPHVDMANRSFVLEPLAELCPGKIHPVLRLSVQQLLKNLCK